MLIIHETMKLSSIYLIIKRSYQVFKLFKSQSDYVIITSQDGCCILYSNKDFDYKVQHGL